MKRSAKLHHEVPVATGQEGLSLAETLVAAGLLLIVTLGLLPLFTRAIVNNNTGQEYTQVSNFGKSRVEEAFQIPFNGVDILTVDSGDTSKVTVQHFRDDLGEWDDGPVPTGVITDPDSPFGVARIPWLRTLTVRQYNINAIDEEDTNALDVAHSEALNGSVGPEFVHIKEIEVVVESTRTGGPLGAGKQVLLRTLKAK